MTTYYLVEYRLRRPGLACINSTIPASEWRGLGVGWGQRLCAHGIGGLRPVHTRDEALALCLSWSNANAHLSPRMRIRRAGLAAPWKAWKFRP